MKIKKLSIILIIAFLLAFICSTNIFAETENSEKNIGISYTTHVQNIGWQDLRENGEMAGTSGLSYRLEGIKINLLNAPKNAKINYQVHVQNIGWQGIKENGELAGTSGLSYRLEGIKISLENLDSYSVMYRVHVQNIGWQDWRYDGEMAGTTGLGYRLEAIEIKIVPKTERGILKIESPTKNKEINDNFVDISGWCLSNTLEDSIKVMVDDQYVQSDIKRTPRTDLAEITGGYGNSKLNPNAGYNTRIDLTNYKDGVHNIKLELYTKSGNLADTKSVTINLDRSMKIKYTTHVQNIGWQNYVRNGEMAGTSGLSYRLEGIKIDLLNAPENAKVNYQVHVQNIGWQGLRENGEMAGTSGLSYRLEGIKINLENLDNYSVMYRVHVQNIGWQDWRYDGEMAGTTGLGYRLEAIEIKIVPKTERGILKIESPANNYEVNTKTLNVTGWCMSNTNTNYIKAKINSKEVATTVNRKYRGDVLGTTGGYGGEKMNPEAGYEAEINLADYEDGDYEVTLELYSNNNQLLDTKKVKIVIDRTMKILYSAHVQNIGWQSYVRNGEMIGTTGQGLRIEALRISLKNAPENVKIEYHAYVQNIGWQSWQQDNQIAGTIGQGLRIEAMEIKLIDRNTNKEIQNMTVEYQAHVQGDGWQKTKVDGETAGTLGEGLRIEAFKIILVNKKLPRGKIVLESPSRTVFTGDSVTVKGWEMSTQSANSKIEIYINGNLTSLPITRTNRTDIQNIYTFYGDAKVNPNPGYNFTIDLTNYTEGIYNIEIRLYSEDKSRLLDTVYKKISVIKGVKFGIDVSKWQGKIDWNRVKQEDVNYSIIRIGYGQTVDKNKDAFFEANYNSCKQNGIPVGVYLYSYALNVEEARLEAEACIKWLNGRNLQLPVFWDVEDKCQSNIDRNTLTAMADTFCSTIEQGGKYKAGIYGNKNWLTNKLNMGYLQEKYDVWVAQYYHECTYDGRYDIWQYSSEGYISGISGKVDCNYFYKKY